MRKLPAIVITAGLVVSLSACTAFPSDSCTPQVAPGPNSELVSANGTFGKDPKASFPTPLITEAAEASELIIGEGAVAREGDVVDFQVTALLGETGEIITSSSYDSTAPVRRTIAQVDPLGVLLECTAVGSRVAATITFGEAFPTADPAASGAKADDAIVLVFDVQRVLPGRATGVDQLAPSGFPSIALAPNGQPGFTFASGPTPSASNFAVLKLGNGPIVEEGDTVVIHMTGLVWETESIFFSSWDNGSPINVTAASSAGDPNGLPAGWADALIGQKVGSQVIVIVAPADGYPAGTEPEGVVQGDTIVVVFDILGII